MGNVLRGVKRKVATGLVVMLAVVGVNVVVASPAMADCSVNAIQLQVYRSADLIVGGARFVGCGNPNSAAMAYIQRSRWYGWEDLASTQFRGDGRWYSMYYNCTGSGTHTYRTIATGRTVGGSPIFKSSGQIRTTC